VTENLDRSAEDLAHLSTDELTQIADLPAIIDVFLRSEPTPGLLVQHLHRLGSDHPGYDAALLIDQIGFTADALHTRVSVPHR
jgi:hypothetical protein